MRDDCFLVLLLLVVLHLLYKNSHSKEYMDNGIPNMFIPEGYGEKGMYYDNLDFAPVYRTVKQHTIFD